MAGYGRKKKKKHQNGFSMFAILLVLVALVLAFGVQTRSLQKKSDEYNETLSRLEAQIEEEENRSEELEETRIYTQTKQYIEEQARIRLGLVNPDEIVLKPEN